MYLKIRRKIVFVKYAVAEAAATAPPPRPPSAQLHRHEDPLAVALDQQRHALAACPSAQRCTCSTDCTGLPLIASSTSPGSMPARAAGAGGVLDHQAARARSARWRSPRRERPQRQAELARLGVAARAGRGLVAVVGARRAWPRACALDLSRQTFELDLARPARDMPMQARQAARAFDRLAVDLGDHVARLQAGRRGRAARRHAARPARLRAAAGRTNRPAAGSGPAPRRRAARAAPCRWRRSGP